MVLTIGMLMEAHCPTHRNVQQANQLARFSLTAGTGNEGLQIHLTGTDGHSTPALQVTVPPFLRSLEFSSAVKQRVGRFIDLHRVSPLADFVKRHQRVIMCGSLIRQPQRSTVPGETQYIWIAVKTGGHIRSGSLTRARLFVEVDTEAIRTSKANQRGGQCCGHPSHHRVITKGQTSYVLPPALNGTAGGVTGCGRTSSAKQHRLIWSTDDLAIRHDIGATLPARSMRNVPYLTIGTALQPVGQRCT
ncbi:Uncharacterised protein [Klebsiella pneumoniae]|nr:Uncharacterised protein [Klebsiella pneumoniae]